MKRRTVIQQLGMGLAAGLTLPAWLSACSEEKIKTTLQYDGVIGIVGAGASGLCAADILQSAGLKVRIFEASNQIGGRVRSLKRFNAPDEALKFNPDSFPVSDFPIELGASEIIGSDSVWAKQAAQTDVDTLDYLPYATDHAYLINNQLKLQSELTANASFLSAQNFYNSLSTLTGSGSVQQAINTASIDPSMNNVLEGWIGNTFGTNNSNLGLQALVDINDKITHDNKRLLLRKNNMQDVLLARYDKVTRKVETETIISHVNYSGEKIVLTGTQQGIAFTAEVDKVIVTVPVKIIQSDKIQFTPALPASKLTALSHMQMDNAVQMFIEFKKNFWGSTLGFIHGGEVTPMYYNAGLGRSVNARALSITAQGSWAETLSQAGEDAIQLVLQELDALYGGQATQNIRRTADDKMLYVLMDWSKVTYIGGGTAYVKPSGSNEDRVVLAETINEKLFFAGEATDTQGDFYNLSGAIRSATRAAEEIKLLVSDQ